MTFFTTINRKLTMLLGMIITIIQKSIKIAKYGIINPIITIASKLYVISGIFKCNILNCCKSRRQILIEEGINLKEKIQRKAYILQQLKMNRDEESETLLRDIIDVQERINEIYNINQ